MHRGIAQAAQGQPAKKHIGALYSDGSSLFKDLANTKSKVRGKKVATAKLAHTARPHPPGDLVQVEDLLQATYPGSGQYPTISQLHIEDPLQATSRPISVPISRPGTRGEGGSRPGTRGKPDNRHRAVPEPPYEGAGPTAPPPKGFDQFPMFMHQSASQSSFGLGSLIADGSLQDLQAATLREPETVTIPRPTSKGSRPGTTNSRGVGTLKGFPIGFKRLLRPFIGTGQKSSASKPAKVKQTSGIVPGAGWDQTWPGAVRNPQQPDHGVPVPSQTWPSSWDEPTRGGDPASRSPASPTFTMKKNQHSDSMKSFSSHMASAKSLQSTPYSAMSSLQSLQSQPYSAMSSLPETLDPETEEKMKEVAFALADRYQGGIARLTNAQADWRKKHDAWMKRRQIQGDDSPETRPPAKSAKRRTKPPLPQGLPTKTVGSNEAPIDWTHTMNELRDGTGNHLQNQRAILQSILNSAPGFPGVELHKPQKLGNSHETTVKSENEPVASGMDGLRLNLTRRTSKDHGFFAGLRQEEPLDEKHNELTRAEDKRRDLKSEKTSDFEQNNFELIVRMAKKFNMTVPQVKSEFAEFGRHDKDGSGLLDKDEFLDTLRKSLKLGPGGRIPRHLLQKEWAEADVDGDGQIDFEEYLTWAQNVAFQQELHCKDQLEADMRELSKKHGVPLPDIEVIRKAFDRFDEDNSGMIDKREFKGVLLLLLKAKHSSDLPPDRLERYWKEVDVDHSGAIEFEEFLLWYMKYFFDPTGNAGKSSDPTTQAYAKLGANRLRPLFNALGMS